jgi:hypothetical protein
MAKPRPYKPSAAGMRVLRNIAAGRGADWGLKSMSEHGGLWATCQALRRHGMLSGDGQITDAGRAALGTSVMPPGHQAQLCDGGA